MSAHLKLEGGWANCPVPESCALLFHFDMNAAEAAQIPIETLYPVFEAIQPPDEILDGWLKIWRNAEGVSHRDYDLPAHVGVLDTRSFTWYQHGEIHRDGDKPAAVDRRGDVWFQHGQYHRDGDKPARILHGQVQQWFRRGQQHRDHDLPAAVYDDGGLEWYKDNELHRRGGKPALMWANGRREWHQLGMLQRAGWTAKGIPDPNEETQLDKSQAASGTLSWL